MRRSGGVRAFGEALAAPLFIGINLLVFLLALSPPKAITPTSERTVADMTGNRVGLVGPAKHAVIYPLIAADYLAIDPNPEHLAGVSGRNATAARQDLLGAIYPQLQKLPLTGPTVYPADPERLLGMQPDVVLAINERSEVLDAMGFSAVLKIHYSEEMLERPRFWVLLGAATGDRKRAESLYMRHALQMSELESTLATAAPPLKAIILNGNGVAWWIASGRSYYLNPLLRAAHIVNAGGPLFSADTDNTLEQLLVVNPDIILLDSGEITPQSIYARSEYALLKAVRDHRVYRIPAHADMSALTQELLLRWLAEVSEPDRFAPEVRQLYRDSYKKVYGCLVSDEQIDEALHVRDNLHSRGYSRFLRASLPEESATNSKK